MPAYYNRAQAKMELNRYAEGIADYDKALEFPMSEADAYGAYYNRALAKYLLGVEKAAAGEEEAAVELYHASIPDYTAAIKVAPDRSLTGRNYNNRGYSKYLIAEYESAIGNMEEARELYEAAMLDSEKAIQYDRKNAYAYCTRAVTKVAFEIYDGAIDDFNRALKLDPGFAHRLSPARGLRSGRSDRKKQRKRIFGRRNNWTRTWGNKGVWVIGFRLTFG